MKKIKRTFDIQQWIKVRNDARAIRKEYWGVIKGHPLTWLVLIITLVYTHAWWIS